MIFWNSRQLNRNGYTYFLSYWRKMSTFAQFALLLAFLLLVAKIAGSLSVWLGQPSILGELIAGLLIGPTLLNIGQWSVFSDSSVSSGIDLVAQFGVVVLMFAAGLELHIGDLARNAHPSILAAGCGVGLSLFAGWCIGLAFGMASGPALMLGLMIGATSVSISVQTLIEIKALKTRVGMGILGAAVCDDILVLLLLALVSVFQGSAHGMGSLALVIVRALAFFAASLLFGWFVLPKLTAWVKTLPISQGPLALAVCTLLIYGTAAEALGGMAPIMGAFIAGLMFSRVREKSEIDRCPRHRLRTAHPHLFHAAGYDARPARSACQRHRFTARPDGCRGPGQAARCRIRLSPGRFQPERGSSAGRRHDSSR
jgi:Kef-type K+ transport system membrane component KefB